MNAWPFPNRPFPGQRYGWHWLVATSQWLLLLVATSRCYVPSQPAMRGGHAVVDSNAVYRLTEIGDSLYAQKQTYRSFADAMVYYDSAAQLAQSLDDNFVKGYVVFCKASVYNAWNKEPHRTIELFQEAIALYRRGTALKNRRRQYYCWYLVAHAYDNEKGHDSTHCVQTLYQIRDSLRTLPRSVWQAWKFVPDLAWVATNANNYPLAQALLTELTQRPLIVNDPHTNNYLDHYYLTQARLAVYWHHQPTSPYLDSLKSAYQTQKPDFDRLYYGENLARLYAASGHYLLAYTLSQANARLSARLSDSAGINSLRNRLLQTQLASEYKDKALAQTSHQNRIRLLWLLSGSLLIILLFSYRFFRGQIRYQQQSIQLAQSNRYLDEKVQEIDLLNKEMQHRIKNNLQMIQSLVYMQQRDSASQEVRQNMQQMGLRIQSIASLHEELMRTRDQPIDLQAYLSRMLNTVVELMDRPQRVVTHFAIEVVSLSPRQSFPLSLILTEWLTNSLKYATVAGQTLSIYLTVKHEQGSLRVEYYDSGRAVPVGELADGLGLRIVALLTAQLRASLRRDPYSAYHYHLLLDGE